MLRLIDANALEAIFKDENHFYDGDTRKDTFKTGIARAIELLDSAPTVETTDDVLERLQTDTELQSCYDGEYRATHEYSPKAHYGKTPLEAVRSLEASLNQK